VEEVKLSAKERELLEPFYETDVYQKALAPMLERWLMNISRNGLTQAPDWDSVLELRGQIHIVKNLMARIERINKDSRKKRETK
jgi:hypothetical protein